MEYDGFYVLYLATEHSFLNFFKHAMQNNSKRGIEIIGEKLQCTDW